MSDRLREASLVIMRTWAVYNPSMNFFTNAGLALVLLYGGRQVLAGQMALGGFVAVLTLVRFLYEPVRQLHSLNQLIQSGRAAGGRVFEILDTPTETSDDLPTADARRTRQVEIVGRRPVQQRGFLVRRGAARCSRTSPCTRRPARPLRWWVRPARENPRWSTC